MALPQYDAEAGAQTSAVRKNRKLQVVGVVMAGVMAACITLLAVGQSGSAVTKPSARLDSLLA
jgi:hypothetical protein